jgi:RHS repeat-associated protein
MSKSFLSFVWVAALFSQTMFGGLTAAEPENLEEKIIQALVFPQRIVPVGEAAPLAADSQTLWSALGQFQKGGAAAGIQALESFLTANPSSAWAPSLRGHLAEYYRDHGRYSLAVAHWQAAWEATKHFQAGNGRDVADQVLANGSQFLARAGQKEALESWILDARDREVGQVNYRQLYTAAQERLGLLKDQPRQVARCGAYALELVGLELRGSVYDPVKLQFIPSPRGFSMTELVALSKHCRLGLTPVEWIKSEPLPVPCVVHWRLNHYGAILARKGTQYLVNDGLTDHPHWVSAQTIAQESSGFFLVPFEQAPAHWKSLIAAETDQILGTCHSPIMMDAEEEPPSSLCSGQEDPLNPGMPMWMVSEPMLNLWLEDTPMQYQPGLGPLVSVQLRHKQRDHRLRNPRIFDVSTNSLWTLNWQAYLEESDTNYGTLMQPATRLNVGGSRTAQKLTEGQPVPINIGFSRGNAAVINYLETSTAHYRTGSRLEIDTTQNSTNYTVRYNDGSEEVFAYRVGFASGKNWYFRTRLTDPYGHFLRFEYTQVGDVVRLDRVIDGDGKTNLVQYVSANSGLIREIVNPFGQTVTFGQSSNGALTNITDVVGIKSAFRYDTNGWVTNLVTPYGTTHFRYRGTVDGALLPDNTVNRAVEITEPNQGKQLYIYRQLADQWNPGNQSPLLSSSETAPVTPLNTFDNGALHYRNSFHWDQHQYEVLTAAFRNAATLDQNAFNLLVPRDYLIARRKHWLAKDSMNIGETLALEQQPSPEGTTPGQLTWYDYHGKTSPFDREGTHPVPAAIARILPNGESQYVYYEYNDLRQPTLRVATYSLADGSVGTRTNRYLYNTANNIDLRENWFESATESFRVAAYGYDANHRRITFTNSMNEVTLVSYDSAQRLQSVAFPSGVTRCYYYDPSGSYPNDPSSIVDRLTATGVALATSTFAYSNGQLCRYTDARGLTMTNCWDALGRLTGRVFPDGTTVSNLYYLRNGQTYPNSTGGSSILDVTAFKDRKNQWTYFGYDEIGRLTTLTNARQNVTTLEYCGCGAVEQITDASQNSTGFFYDYAGRIERKVLPDGKVIVFKHDGCGRLTNVVDPNMIAFDLAYNNQGRITEISTGFGRLQKIVYDHRDRTQSLIDANGVTVTQTFDRRGRVLTRNYPLGGPEQFGYVLNVADVSLYTNQLGVVSQYLYDAQGRLTDEVQALGKPDQTQIHYTYDAAGDLLTLTDGRGKNTSWKYDVYGRVTNKLDHLNQELFRYAYDPENNLTTRWAKKTGSTTAYEYDAVGNLTRIDYPNSPDITLDYDSLDRPTNAVVHYLNPSDNLINRFGFNARGRVIYEDGPWANDQVTYGYRDNGLRASLSLQQAAGGSWNVNYSYDNGNRLTDLSTPAGNFHYAYDPTRKLEVNNLTLPTSGRIQNAYDAMARLTGTTLLNAGQLVQNQHQYLYNNASQRIQQTRTGGNHVDYSYDNLGQLITATARENGSETLRWQEDLKYKYDAAGNLIIRTNHGLVQTFAANDLNQVTTINNSGTLTVAGTVTPAATGVTVNGQPAARYGDNTFAREGLPLPNGTTTYTAVATDGAGNTDTHSVTVNLPNNVTFSTDGDGNLTGDGQKEYVYDDEDQLTSVTVAGAWRTEFAYDAFGRMARRREFTWQSGGWLSANEVRYVYDGRLVVEERDGANQPRVTYTRGKDLSGSLSGAGGIGGLLARSHRTDSPNHHFYYHADGGGNVTAIINQSQNLVAQYAYDPFGRLLIARGALAEGNPYRFSSKEYHANAGLYYYGFRFYDPANQRWLSRDPIGERGGLNLYIFAGNSPVNFIDPYGLTWWISRYPFFPGQFALLGPYYAIWIDDGINQVKQPLKLTCKKLWQEELITYNELQNKNRFNAFNIFTAFNINDEKGFDTSFFKGYENSDRLYYEYRSRNYADNEINYFGIGMYENWKGNPRFVADLITYWYKRLNRWGPPNANTYYWLHKGYEDYSIIKNMRKLKRK